MALPFSRDRRCVVVPVPATQTAIKSTTMTTNARSSRRIPTDSRTKMGVLIPTTTAIGYSTSTIGVLLKQPTKTAIWTKMGVRIKITRTSQCLV